MQKISDYQCSWFALKTIIQLILPKSDEFQIIPVSRIISFSCWMKKIGPLFWTAVAIWSLTDNHRADFCVSFYGVRKQCTREISSFSWYWHVLQVLIETAKKLGLQCHSKGTMITIEGPRFSSRAESLMFRSWGADVINMTTVPEVILAKEAGMSYASIAMATDYDCWKEHEEAVSGTLLLWVWSWEIWMRTCRFWKRSHSELNLFLHNISITELFWRNDCESKNRINCCYLIHFHKLSSLWELGIVCVYMKPCVWAYLPITGLVCFAGLCKMMYLL